MGYRLNNQGDYEWRDEWVDESPFGAAPSNAEGNPLWVPQPLPTPITQYPTEKEVSPYMQGLFDQGIIQQDNYAWGKPEMGYAGTDGNVYFDHYSHNSDSSWRMTNSGDTEWRPEWGDPNKPLTSSLVGMADMSQFGPNGEKPATGTLEGFFLDPTSGQQVGTYSNNFEERGIGEMLTMAFLAVVTAGAGGAALGGAGAAGGGGAGAATGGAGGFIGEGVASGIGAWDAALAASPSWSAAGGMVGGLDGYMAYSPEAAASTGEGLAGETLSKAALDGTNYFGANSVNGALDISGLSGATSSSAAAKAVGELATSLGYTGPSATTNIGKLLTKLGVNPESLKTAEGFLAAAKEYAPLLAAGAQMLGGGGDMPTLGGGGGAGGAGGDQAAQAKSFLETVLPYLRTNSSNPYGSANWSRGADGSWSLATKLEPGQQQMFDDTTAKLKNFLGSLDNASAPQLLDSAGGNYSEQLAKTIFDRTWGMQENDINERRQAQMARMAEQGFTPGSTGYINEMNRWEDNLGEMRQSVSKDAQIQAAKQALAEASFTNDSRTQGFKNQSDLRGQIAQILGGTRNNLTEGLKSLTTQASAPTGAPANAAALQQNQYNADLAAYNNKTQQINDLLQALMQWGLS